jgi:flavin prenyltransferase
LLLTLGIETHLIMSRAAQITLAHDTDLKGAAVEALADKVYRADDVDGAIAMDRSREWVC